MGKIAGIQTGQRLTLLTLIGLQLMGLGACIPSSPSLAAPIAASPRPPSPSSNHPSLQTPASVCAQGRHFGKVTALAIAPDGKTLISSGEDTTIKIWDLTTNLLRRSLPGTATSVAVMTLSPKGDLLASAGTNHLLAADTPMINIWDVKSGALLKP